MLHQMPTSSSSNHFQKEKQLLLEQTKSLVNRCMKRFVNRYELGTDNDPLIIDLCCCLEQIFCHGWKKTNSSSTRKNKLLAGILSKNESFFWNFIVLFLNDHEIEHFSSLRNVHTDLGRGRSWIRNCLNEHSLHKYFHMILEDKSAHRPNFYHDWALLLDDQSSELPSIFENLNSILFALTIDTSDLDVPASDPSKTNTQKSDDLAPIQRNNQNILVESLNKKSNMIIIQDDMSDDVYAKSAPNTFTIESFGTNFAEDHLSTSAFSANQPSSLCLYPIENEQIFEKDEEEEEEQSSKVVNEELLIETIDELQRSKDKLSRENILLNIKLKKYLATIELLKYDRNKHKDNDHDDDDGGGGQREQEENSVPNHNAEIESYEQKLMKISEMHGEIVEFNEHLYKIIQIKDSIIARLRDELVELRGPLPDNDETMSIESEIETNTHSLQSLPQPLIHIWIPTAFLSGGFKGKSHHIYQIYVRIKEEEWNVYRRYSQFYSLNKLLKNQYPHTSRYEFPPKKAIGNKDSRVVQERRKKLEAYLRSVINHIQTQNTDIINKEKFISILPFLSDKYFLQDRSQSESNLNDARLNQQQQQQSHSRNYMGF